jgi:glycosyltransferase involved in cell wall biosynthesis
MLLLSTLKHYEKNKIYFFLSSRRFKKGFSELMKAFETLKEAHPDAFILIVGDKNRAEKMTGNGDRSRLIETGWQDRPALLALMSLSSFVVTPSVCFDSFPTVNLEAMALAKPVIATQFGGSRELILDRETGFIVDPRDTPQFAERMKKLLDEPLLAERMGKIGQGRIAVSFTVKKQVETYLSQ